MKAPIKRIDECAVKRAWTKTLVTNVGTNQQFKHLSAFFKFEKRLLDPRRSAVVAR